MCELNSYQYLKYQIKNVMFIITSTFNTYALILPGTLATAVYFFN